MTSPDNRIEEVLAKVEQLDAVACSVSLQLRELAKTLRALQRGEPPEPKVGKPKALRVTKKSDAKAATSPRTLKPKYNPPKGQLPNLFASYCPRCGRTMAWRWSKEKQQDFAGCTDFPNCRGTRSLEDVLESERISYERSVEGGFAGNVREFRELQLERAWERRLAGPQKATLRQIEEDLITVGVKHHGEEALTVGKAVTFSGSLDDPDDIPF